MDRSEELAKVYLDSLGLGPTVYEPDGQVPPDFIIGDIGIEVRRLNQNFESDDGYEGLESVEASVLRYVEKFLPTYGPPKDGQGWWVSLTFWRPLDGKAVKRELPKVLAAFHAHPNPEGLDAKLTQNFELEIRPAAFRSPTTSCWARRPTSTRAGSLPAKSSATSTSASPRKQRRLHPT